MGFHEVSLPARLAFGSTGGVERRTEVVTLASGFERRSTPWAEGRRRWLIGANLRTLADMAELVAFFEARMGRLFGFRFRDFMDFRSCAPGSEPAATDQALETGDGETVAFQLRKGERVIRKPVAGSVVVAVDGVVVAAEVDAATGVVTLAAAPAEGAAVTAGFLFDVPVRFDADRIDVTLESFDAGRMTAVPLVEIRI
jgi:uncharacterized protein (TIGR02217 family)